MSTSTKIDSSKEILPHGFVRLGEGIWFVKAENGSSRQPSDLDPTITLPHSLILIFGWMGGKLAHVAKYSQGYQKLFPNTDQIVVSSTNEIFLARQKTLVAKMQPMVEYLISLGVVGPKARPHRILTHTMSNGGSIRLNHLVERLAALSLRPLATSFQPSALIVDSSPGGDNLSSAFLTFRATIPPPLLRYPIIGFILAAHTLAWLLGLAHWKFFEFLRLVMIKPTWLPWMTTSRHGYSTPQLFIYSKADHTTPFKDIQEFTESSEAHGNKIQRLIFEDSDHVSHMRKHPETYWNAIKQCWITSVNSARAAARSST
ncbi:hypothetical protein CPB86DRAFT_803497 [Serendipita vermifera]|nr:hypothetical protein CPB86DRAFT_803497 [Serendipita vermifera]